MPQEPDLFPTSEVLQSGMAGLIGGADRRRFIQAALLAVGAAGASLPAWDSLFASAGKVPFLGTARFGVLDAVAEVIMPRTDTPGARDARVPARFDALMKNWASAQTRTDFQRVLDELDIAARSRNPKGFAALPGTEQLEVATAYDRSHLTDRGYARFKALILSLYYISEPGATRELRYEHVPGAWEPSIPVTADTRGYAVDVNFGGN